MTTELQKAVFFDRDGVINHDLGYIHKVEDFFWIDGAKEAIALCREKGYKIFIVTNQSGIARGLYTEKEVEVLHNFIQDELKKEDTFIDEYSFCPHHPQGIVEEYSKQCNCRKPEPGMIIELIKKHHIDVSQSFIIGDHPRDVEAGKNAGIDGYLFTGKNILDFVKEIFENRNN